MKIIIFILNLPFTLTGIIPLILSVPYTVRLHKNPIAFIFRVKSFWFGFFGRQYKYARAMTIGNIILLGPKELKNDLEHELIHVKQTEKYPFIYPFLYLYELVKNGYRQNRFEDEAFTISKCFHKVTK